MKYPFSILDKKRFAACFFNALVENFCIYLIPFVLSYYTREPFTLGRFRDLIILLIVLHTLRLLCDSIWTIYVATFIQKFKHKLQLSYFKRLCHMKSQKMEENHNGFVKKQIDVVATECETFLRYLMSNIPGFIAAIGIFLYQVFCQDQRIFVFAIVLIVAIILINVKIGKFAVKTRRVYNDMNARYHASYVDFLQNIKTVKKLNKMKFATNHMDDKFYQTVVPYKNMKKVISLRAHGISFLVYCMYFIIMIGLYVQMKQGENVLSYILFYATIFQGVSRELIDLSGFFSTINALTAAGNQLEEMIQEEQQYYVSYFDSLQLKDVKYQYKKQSSTMIEIPDFSVEKGDKVSIVGESGQGKTTLLNMITRDLHLEQGSYWINKEKTDQVLDIAFVSQETSLFDLSLRDNLCLGKEFSDEKLLKLIQEAGLEHWYQSLKNGLDSVVGEQGVTLSAGQKQRINFIRSILLDKEIYILDEPTSNLDRKTEQMIIDMIDRYLRDKTVIIVTHRPELNQICNKIYHFMDHKLCVQNSNSCEDLS